MFQKAFCITITFLFISLSSLQAAGESFKKAEDFFNKGKFEMALLFYNREITENPDNGTAYFHRGKIYFYNKAYTNSLQDFNRAGDLLPKNKNVMFAIANSLAMTGAIDEAIEQNNKILKMDKNFAFSYLNLGNIYLKAKHDKENTISSWETFLNTLPAYEQADDIRKAIAYLKSPEFSWNDIEPLNPASTSGSNRMSNAAGDTNAKLNLDNILPDMNIEGEGTKSDVSKQKGMAGKKSIETE